MTIALLGVYPPEARGHGQTGQIGQTVKIGQKTDKTDKADRTGKTDRTGDASRAGSFTMQSVNVDKLFFLIFINLPLHRGDPHFAHLSMFVHLSTFVRVHGLPGV